MAVTKTITNPRPWPGSRPPPRPAPRPPRGRGRPSRGTPPKGAYKPPQGVHIPKAGLTKSPSRPNVPFGKRDYYQQLSPQSRALLLARFGKLRGAARFMPLVRTAEILMAIQDWREQHGYEDGLLASPKVPRFVLPPDWEMACQSTGGTEVPGSGGCGFGDHYGNPTQWPINPNARYAELATIGHRHPVLQDYYWLSNLSHAYYIPFNVPPSRPGMVPTPLPDFRPPGLPAIAPKPWLARKKEPSPNIGPQGAEAPRSTSPRVSPEYSNSAPPPGTKEKKVQMSPTAKWLMEIAWEMTEVADIIDAAFDALPDHIKKKVGKTGITSKTAQYPGKKYTSVMDKAKLVYEHYDQMDVIQFQQNLLHNNLTDMMANEFFGGIEKARERAGGTGWNIWFAGLGSP